MRMLLFLLVLPGFTGCAESAIIHTNFIDAGVDYDEPLTTFEIVGVGPVFHNWSTMGAWSNTTNIGVIRLDRPSAEMLMLTPTTNVSMGLLFAEPVAVGHSFRVCSTVPAQATVILTVPIPNTARNDTTTLRNVTFPAC